MAPMYEELYSKQIALIIDKALPGTNITLDISKLYEISDKNKYNGQIINIDNSLNRVNIRLADGKGNEYKYFSDYNVLWNIKENEKRLYIYVIESSNEILNNDSIIRGEENDKTNL